MIKKGPKMILSLCSYLVLFPKKRQLFTQLEDHSIILWHNSDGTLNSFKKSNLSISIYYPRGGGGV